MTDFRVLWALPTFRRLLLARTISNYGNGMGAIAVAFAVLAIPGADAASLSIVLALQAVAIVICLPLGGVIADRFGRARIIAITDSILGTLVVAQGVLVVTGMAQVWMMAVIAVCTGALNGFWYPAFPGLTPEVVTDDEQLQTANSMVSTVSNTALILGAASAGIIVAGVGPGWSLIIDGLTFLAAGVLVWGLRHLSRPHRSGESMVYDLRHGWGAFTSRRWIVVVVIAFAFFNMAFQASNGVLGPVLMKEHYSGAASWALLSALESAGLLLGAVVSSRIRVRHPIFVGVLITMAGPLWMSLLALQAPLALIAVSSFIFGMAIETFLVIWSTALQREVPRESLSRVSSYDAFGSLMFGPIGLAVAGPLATNWGTSAVLWGCAAISGVALLAALLDPQLRTVAPLTGSGAGRREGAPSPAD